MNSRTARLLRRYAAATRTPKRWWFRAWNETPRNKRGDMRIRLGIRTRVYEAANALRARTSRVAR